jgi:23S rRNA (adenine-N6)-dimethyltransferase
VSADKRTRWGWHQLTDNWAQLLVEQAAIQPGDLVIDVGAGTGALTAVLVHAGARVIAVELHPRRAQQLRERFSHPPVTVVQADAADLRLPRRPFHVVANPPFAITTALIRRLLSPGSQLVSAHIVVPRYSAERWSSQQHHGANRWSRSFAVTVDRVLPRTAFRPVPPGQVAVLRIERRTAPTARSRAPRHPPDGW